MKMTPHAIKAGYLIYLWKGEDIHSCTDGGLLA